MLELKIIDINYFIFSLSFLFSNLGLEFNIMLQLLYTVIYFIIHQVILVTVTSYSYIEGYYTIY